MPLEARHHELLFAKLHGLSNSDPLGLRCRYPMYIESDAWVTNLKQKLACGSILISNKMEYYEWFTRALQPGLHYVQVDPGDLCNDTAFKVGQPAVQLDLALVGWQALAACCMAGFVQVMVTALSHAYHVLWLDSRHAAQRICKPLMSGRPHPTGVASAGAPDDPGI